MNYAFERAHAPHVDPEWTNAFIAEARLANLNGTTIGDALAEIDTHVVSSGESAKAAFGDPRSYAQALATSAGASPTSTVGAVTAPAAQTIGVILIPIGIMALRHHHRVDITTGIIIAAALVLIPWVILSVRASTLLRAVTHTKAMPWAVFVTALWFGALVIPPIVLTRVVGQLPAWTVVATGAAGTVIGTGISLSEGPLSDPIVAPGSTTPKQRTDVTAVWILPAFTVVLATLAWFLA